MAKFGSNSVLIGITTASGSTALQQIEQYVDTINGIKLNALTQETHAFGDAWAENAPTGVKQIDDITMSGFYDDAASTGIHALLGNTSHIGAERAVEIDYGSSDVQRVSVIVLSYSRMPTRGELTRWEAVLKPTGAPSSAT